MGMEKHPNYDAIMEILAETFGWDVTTTPDEKLITAELLNDTLKAVDIFIKDTPVSNVPAEPVQSKYGPEGNCPHCGGKCHFT